MARPMPFYAFWSFLNVWFSNNYFIQNNETGLVHAAPDPRGKGDLERLTWLLLVLSTVTKYKFDWSTLNLHKLWQHCSTEEDINHVA